MKCERMVPHSNSWGKWKTQCGKPGVEKDVHGRLLCVKCLQKFKEKANKNKKLKSQEQC